MFKIGIWEILIIVLMVIVFLRPKDLPELFRKIGRFYAQIKDLSKVVSAGIRDFENDLNVHTRSFEKHSSSDSTVEKDMRPENPSNPRIERDTTATQAADTSGETDDRKYHGI